MSMLLRVRSSSISSFILAITPSDIFDPTSIAISKSEVSPAQPFALDPKRKIRASGRYLAMMPATSASISSADKGFGCAICFMVSPPDDLSHHTIFFIY